MLKKDKFITKIFHHSTQFLIIAQFFIKRKQYNSSGIQKQHNRVSHRLSNTPLIKLNKIKVGFMPEAYQAQPEKPQIFAKLEQC